MSCAVLQRMVKVAVGLSLATIAFLWWSGQASASPLGDAVDGLTDRVDRSVAVATTTVERSIDRSSAVVADRPSTPPPVASLVTGTVVPTTDRLLDGVSSITAGTTGTVDRAAVAVLPPVEVTVPPLGHLDEIVPVTPAPVPALGAVALPLGPEPTFDPGGDAPDVPSASAAPGVPTVAVPVAARPLGAAPSALHTSGSSAVLVVPTEPSAHGRWPLDVVAGGLAATGSSVGGASGAVPLLLAVLAAGLVACPGPTRRAVADAVIGTADPTFGVAFSPD